MQPSQLLKLRPIFLLLNQKLIELLISLNETEWHAPTIAKLWSVKDVAAHMLDTNIRGLSFSRDQYFGEPAPNIHSYGDLVDFLNRLNMRFTTAAKGMSPQVLIDLLQLTGQQFVDHLDSLNPYDKAIFSVAWAGQDESPNWFHIAREYTEKFLHQQQIRDAVGKQGILTKDLFHPFIHTLLLGLPHTFKNSTANEGTVVHICINTDAGGDWYLVKNSEHWILHTESKEPPNAKVELSPDIAWKLFSKGISPTEAIQSSVIRGDQALGEQVFNLVAVMA